jgi:hypothetical protein
MGYSPDTRQAAAALGLLLALETVAQAHVNDRGMDYRRYKDTAGIPCCSKDDCQPAEKFVETVENGREVVRLLIDGVWITVPRSFLSPRQATDGRAHWCGIKVRVGDAWRPGTRCIILPPRLL